MQRTASEIVRRAPGRAALPACLAMLGIAFALPTAGAAAGSLPAFTPAAATWSDGNGLTPSAPDAATLVQCQTAGEVAERAATFGGEMIAIPGAARMSMRVDLLERMEGESRYHTVAAPGLGVWRVADPGVAVFKYVKQVTNMSSPAAYRALFTFRWQGARGRTVRREEKRTRRCVQPGPAPAPPVGPPPSPSPPSVE